LKSISGSAVTALAPEKGAEFHETIRLLTDNLGKIGEHGKRADGIVRSKHATAFERR